jgi:hypothetical protein
MLVFDTGKTLMLGGAGGGGSEVAMDVDGSWMEAYLVLLVQCLLWSTESALREVQFGRGRGYS